MSGNKWITAEDRIMKRLYPNQSSESVASVLNRSLRSVYSRANTLGLKKTEKYLNSEASGRLTKGSVAGYNTRYKKGQEIYNKGLTQQQYRSAAAIKKTKATRFKKGQKPHNTKPIGIIEPRIDKSGKTYLYIKHSDKNWQLYQRFIWEQNFGTIPPGHIIRFKDKNSLNCDIDNLFMISKADNMRQNSIQRYPPEIKEVMRLQGKLTRTIIKKQNNGKR
jgi:hypothetical protein